MEQPPTRINLSLLTDLLKFEPDDAQPLHEAIVASTAELAPWLAWCTLPVKLEDQQSFIARAQHKWEHEGVYHYGVWRGPTLAGAASILGGPDETTREIGYWIATPDTGRGLATRAARALTKTALMLDGISRVQICCDAANTPSARVAQRAGYRLDRVDEVEVVAPGETGREMVWYYP